MPIRLTGLASGLDTETIISALVSSYNYKTEKYKKAQTKLSWKQDAWKTLNTKIYSLYTSLDGLRFSNNYNLKATTCSDTTKATVTATSNAVNGTQKLNIINVAQAGYLTGGKLGSSVSAGTTLAELGYTGGDAKLDLTMGDGTAKSITVSQGSTITDVVNSLKQAGVNASYDEVNKRIYVSSKETGTDNDFTLTGANVDGVSALTKLGLNVDSTATKATYESYAKYNYNGYDLTGSLSSDISQNVKDAITAYNNALAQNKTASAQNANLSAAYGYASAYSAMKTALESTPLTADEQDKLRTLLSMNATGRVNSVMDADGNVYSAKTVDGDGNAIFSYKDGDGNEKLIKRVVTYTGSDSKNYTLNADKTYTDGDGNVYKASSEKDPDGKTYYVHTADDGTETKITIDSHTNYYDTAATEEGTGLYKCTDADSNVYTQNSTDIAGMVTYSSKNGTMYRLSDDKSTLIQIDAEGNDVSGAASVSVASREEIQETVYHSGAARSDVKRSADEYSSLKTASGLTDAQITTLTNNIAAVNSYEKTADSVLAADDTYSRASITTAIHQAYDTNKAAGVTDLVNTYADIITTNRETIDDSQKVMDQHSVLSGIAAMEDGTAKDEAIAAFVTQAQSSKNILATSEANADAKKIDGQDAVINLNGIKYTGSSNAFSINGLTITAQAVTGESDADAITITTQTDTQGIYDKVKNFLTQYNSLINEITSLYNADSAKGYEPLSDDEKDQMSDTEIEKWEEKIKSSLLRRDDSIESVMNAMTSSMSKGVEVNGKTYYLSNFGIKTLGYLNAPENQQYAYHIDGDEDDASTSGKTDKLMTSIISDPDTVISFMQGLAGNLYTAVGDKMKTTTLSSVYTVYNDKEMASEYSDYTDIIKKWEDKLKEQEDYYYKKFSAMETALTKLQSQTSSMSSLLGS